MASLHNLSLPVLLSAWTSIQRKKNVPTTLTIIEQQAAMAHSELTLAPDQASNSSR